MKPALTPEEWADALDSVPYLTDMVEEAADDLAVAFESGFAKHGTRHALAALALHGQAWGFTHEDVANLKRIGNDYCAWASDSDERERDIAWGFSLLNLAARIEALLPPAP